MQILLLGNPDLKEDAVAVGLLARLQKEFPEVEFEHWDPNEEKEFGERLVLVDTVKGIEKVTRFEDLSAFVSAHGRMTMHDYDLYDDLMLRLKLKKLPQVTVIGIPWGASQELIWNDLVQAIRSL